MKTENMSKSRHEADIADAPVERQLGDRDWQFEDTTSIDNFALTVLEYELRWVTAACANLESWVFDSKQGEKEYREKKRKQYAIFARHKSQLEGALIILKQYMPAGEQLPISFEDPRPEHIGVN